MKKRSSESRKGDITLAILAALRAARATTEELFDVLSYYGYVETYRRARGLSPLKPQKRDVQYSKVEIDKKERLSKLLSKLKREGFITKTGKNQKLGCWAITGRGKIKEQRLQQNAFAKPLYQVEKSKETHIIVFDIPETLRRERDWLRGVLKNFELKMLQKSVWVGKVTLPGEFFDDLRRRGILDYVEVFAVTKGGTLEQLR
jgi:hypothetical protein